MGNTLTKTLLDINKLNNVNTIELATVENLNPLKIKVGGLPLEKENLLMAECLIDFKNILKVGDTLAVQGVDHGQRYIVITKVVAL